MSVPTYDQMIEPVLRFLAGRPSGATAHEVQEAVADKLRLSDADRAELLPSGVQAVYKNRAGWANDRLKRAGLSQSPRRGLWQLTTKGIEFIKAHPSLLTREQVEQLAIGNVAVRLRPRATESASEERTQISASIEPRRRVLMTDLRLRCRS